MPRTYSQILDLAEKMSCTRPLLLVAALFMPTMFAAKNVHNSDSDISSLGFLGQNDIENKQSSLQVSALPTEALQEIPLPLSQAF
jgi:hypothetical protein